jgi:ankyrin repeat protein
MQYVKLNDPFDYDFATETPLMQSISQYDEKSALLAIVSSSMETINQKDCTGRTALDKAVRRKMYLVVEALLIKGAEFDASDEDGLLAEAILFRNEQIIESLLRHAKSEIPNACKDRILKVAFKSKNQKVIKLINKL